jgi:lysophospholipase L1-like esterase
MSGTASQTTGPTALVSGTQYVCVANAYQTNSTTKTITAIMYAADGVTVINQTSCQDTTTWLQNTQGGVGIAVNGTGTQPTFQNITTYSDINNLNATSYTVTLPTTGNSVGNAMGGTVALVGGNNLSSSLSVALSDGASGVFTPNPVVVPSGTTSVSFTYVPATAGTQTITWSHGSTGNVGMTGDGNESAVIAAGLLTLYSNDASCVRSPYNWEPGSIGATSVQSFYGGAYLRFYITGCTSVNVLIDNATTLGYLNWQIDSGSMLNWHSGGDTAITGRAPLSSTSSGGVITGISMPDTGPHVFKLFVDSVPAGVAGRWASTSYLGIQGIQLVGSLASGNPSAVVNGTNKILILGDSITEGLRACQNSPEIDGAEFAWSSLLGTVLQQSATTGGWEYGISGCSSQGYTIAGIGGVVPVFTPGNDSQSSWNKVTAATSRLVGGLISPAPTVILDNHGENDFLQTANPTTVQAAIQGLYTAMRAAAPSALLLGVINFGGGLRTSKIAGINAFITATGDTNTKIIDLNLDLGFSVADPRNRFGSTAFSGDSIHMQPTAGGEVAARLAPQVLTALGLLAAAPGGSGGSGGSGGGGSVPTTYPAAYASAVSTGVNYEVAADVTLPGPSGTWCVRKGTVITNLAQAQRLLSAGVQLLPHP